MLPDTAPPPILSPADQAAAHRARVPLRIMEDMQTCYAGFVAGDVAGFHPEEAAHLVKKGLASYDLAAVPKPRADMHFLPDTEFGALTARKAAGPVAIEFIKEFPPFLPGETVGLEPKLADYLVRKGFGKIPSPKKDTKRTLKAMRAALKG